VTDLRESVLRRSAPRPLFDDIGVNLNRTAALPANQVMVMVAGRASTEQRFARGRLK
jgi:hypothetical protein